MSTYAEKRAASLARNKAALLAIDAGFGGRPVAPPPPPAPVAKVSKPKETKERRVSEVGTSSTSTSTSASGSRSSTRVRKAIQRFSSEKYSDEEEEYFSVGEDSGDEEHSDGERRNRRKSDSGIPRRLNKAGRRNPKVFGHIPGVEVGRVWKSRMACSQDSVHGPPVGGISGNPEVGSWSVALSGGYSEDIDAGYSFTYTGSGGRLLGGTKAAPKNLRTAPQTFDQSFDHGVNAALERSVATKKPVRVVRGFKNPSCFAPEQGTYRYDGLYIITRAWLDVGEAGFKVCRYSFMRMAGQPDIPIKAGREEEAAAIIAEYGKGEGPDAPRSPEKATRSPAKALKAITPVKAVEQKVNEDEEEPSKVASVKRKATEPLKGVKAKLQRSGSRSSPRAPPKKQ